MVLEKQHVEERLMTEILMASSASGYGADVPERVYSTSGDALHAGMSLATPWDERLGADGGEGPMAVRRVRWVKV